MPKSLRQDNRPSFQFYPNDWLSDEGLKLCSLAAQGLWMRMLCIMWHGQPRGTLTVNGIMLDNKGIAKIVGISIDEANQLVVELESNKLFSKLDDGTIYCRRMYRLWQKSEYIRNIRSQAGKKGMAKRWGNRDSKPTAKITASTSFSSSTSNSLNSKFDINKNEDSGRGKISPISLDMLEEMQKNMEQASPEMRKVLRKKYEEMLTKYNKTYILKTPDYDKQQ